MEKLADVRARMRSVSGIGEVCRTLATVASAKLAQTHERARGAREYTSALRSILARQQQAAIADGCDPAALSSLMAVRPQVRNVTLLVIGADRGLCGGHNLALGRAARTFILGRADMGIEVSAVVKGRRAETYLRRTTRVDIVAASDWTRAGVSETEVNALLAQAAGAFLGGQADEVWACYTAFRSTMQRDPAAVRLLPVMPEQEAAVGEEALPGEWQYEPARGTCVRALLEAFVRLQIEDVLLEAFASEQAARMVTMQEASERADRSLATLRVHYNRLRRESITADLVGVLVAGRVRKEAENDGD
jgi:F-type H+-transporting ATPase subunit gamma